MTDSVYHPEVDLETVEAEREIGIVKNELKPEVDQDTVEREREIGVVKNEPEKD